MSEPESMPRNGAHLVLRNGDCVIFRGPHGETHVWIERPPTRGMTSKPASVLDGAVEVPKSFPFPKKSQR